MIGPFFNTAKERREYEEALKEGRIRPEQRADFTFEPIEQRSSPKKNEYYQPMNWTAKERRQLHIFRTEPGMRTLYPRKR